MTVRIRTVLLASAAAITWAPAGSPLAQDIATNPLRDVYYGNLHVHTAWSFDAYINGAIAGPDDAYRWARGEAIPGGKGLPDLKILKPLDWYAVSDHAEYLGALPLMADPSSPVSQHPLAADISGDDAEASFNAYTEILDGISNRRGDPILGDPKLGATVWRQVVDIADQHYTARHLHHLPRLRVDLQPGLAQPASRRDLQTVRRTFPSARCRPSIRTSRRTSGLDGGSSAQQGAELLAIPHNGNASDGLMFPFENSYGGSALNAEYAKTRMRNEPVYEIDPDQGHVGDATRALAQRRVRGFRDLGLHARVDRDPAGAQGWRLHAARRSSAASARVREGNGNPFKFGFIGDSDTHNAASDNRGEQLHRQIRLREQSRAPARRAVRVSAREPTPAGSRVQLRRRWPASGRVENTREAIFDAHACARRPSPPPARACRCASSAAAASPRTRWTAPTGCRRPMTGRADGRRSRPRAGRRRADLPRGGDEGARRRQPRSHPDREGLGRRTASSTEHIYDVAWLGGREPDATAAAPVGNTVDVDGRRPTPTTSAPPS